MPSSNGFWMTREVGKGLGRTFRDPDRTGRRKNSAGVDLQGIHSETTYHFERKTALQ
jgi:hypothetical protein